jgi:hypothetical protein
MIKCKECGHDNELGAIFCRECGGKLDVEAIQPDMIDKKASKNVVGILRNLISAVLLIGLIVVLGLMFYPEKMTSFELNPAQQSAAKDKLNNMLCKIDGGYGDEKYTISPDELTFLYNNELTKNSGDEDAGAGFVIDDMLFEVDDDGFVVATLKGKLFGKVPTTFSLKGILNSSPLSLDVKSAKMGHLPVPGFGHDKVIEKFLPGTNQGIMKQLIDGIDSVTLTDGKFVVKVKSKKK